MGTRELRAPYDASGLKVALVVAEFNASVTDGLLEGALASLQEAGADDVTVVRVPGAFELPLVCRRLAAGGADAVIALGAVVLGETDHYEHIAHRASEGIMSVMLETGVPVGFGVLTVRDPAHALARSRPGPGNKGAEAAEAAVRTAVFLRSIPGVERAGRPRAREGAT